MNKPDLPTRQMIPTWVGGDLVAVEKLEAHEKGLLHMAVSVFVMCGNDVLIQQRAMCKYHTPGLWANTCCTHPLWGEPAEVCAERRLYEELGLKGLPLEYRDQLTYRADVGGGLIEHERVDVFMSRVPRRVVPVPNPEEVMATDWVDMGELAAWVERDPARFTPWLRIYLKDYEAQIFAT
ncbi:MAG: isopentenyl-diphosphate delta-isomerase [Pseudomonadota bacterium]